jgi:hypothetical protein
MNKENNQMKKMGWEDLDSKEGINFYIKRSLMKTMIDVANTNQRS